MGKEADLLFTVPVGIPGWGLGEHKPLIIALFLRIVSRRKWKVPWNIQGSDWGCGTVMDLELECKREWGKPGPVPTEGKLRKVSEEGSERCRNILRKFICRAQKIPSMSEGVVQRLLR